MKFLKFAVGPLVALFIVVGFFAVAPGAVKDAVSDFFSAVNPFHEEKVDRTGPSVLISLTNLSEFRAANAYLETVVDLENDSKLPSWVKGERVIYVGKGDVAAFVDFSELDEQRITVADDKQSATIKLPAPTLDEPVLDLEESYVVEYESGLADKFGGSDLESEAQLKAVEQMAGIADSGDRVIDLARTNTVAMLQGLLGALGYVNVTVVWDDAPAPPPTSSPTPQ